MKEHTLKLDDKYYNYILHGTKRIELRLNDEKRKLMHIGDVLLFYKQPLLKESFKTKIVDLIYFNSFNEAISNIPFELIADINDNKVNLLNDLNRIYSKQKQENYGIIGIKLELLNQ